MDEQSFHDQNFHDKPAPPDPSSGRDGAAPSSSSDGPSGRGAARGGAAPHKDIDWPEGGWRPSDSWHPHEPFLFNHESSSRCFPSIKNKINVVSGGQSFTVERPPPFKSLRDGWEDDALEQIARKDPAYARALKRQRYDEIRLAEARRVVAWLAPDLQLAREGFDHPHRRERERALNRMRKWVWVNEPIINLRMQGFSIRRIAEIVGRDKDTVQRVVAEMGTETTHIEREENVSEAESPTIVERVSDHESRLMEVERQLGLPPGGDKAAEEEVTRLLDAWARGELK